MKFTTQKNYFEEKLSLASRFTPTRISSIPSLQGCLLKISKNKSFVLTTNLNDFFLSEIETTIEDEGEIVFDIKKSLEFLSLLQDKEIYIEIEDNSLVIKQNKTIGYFNTYPIEEFPQAPIIQGEEVLLKKDFVDNISFVLFNASKDEARPILTGIYFTQDKKNTTMVSTDGFRLSIITQPLKESFPQITIPAHIIAEVVKLSKDKKEPLLTISTEQKLIKFNIGDIIIYSRLIDGDFPPFERVIPKTLTTTVKLNRQDFIKNIRLVSVFAREQSDVVIFDIKKTGLYLRPKAQQKKTPEVYQELESFDGEEVKIAFNYKYVLEFLNNVSTESVIAQFNQSTTPGAFKPDNSSSNLHIIMPLRTEETTT